MRFITPAVLFRKMFIVKVLRGYERVRSGPISGLRPGPFPMLPGLLPALLAALPLFPAGASGADPKPYLGVINGDRVQVRTGGSKNHHPFAAVLRGHEVVVVAETDEWCKVLLPRWIPVYVHGNYVRLAGSDGSGAGRLVAGGATGEVTADRLMVRVGQRKEHEPIGVLSRGTRVQSLGSAGEWLKILPENGIYGWIYRTYIRKDKDLPAGEAVRVWTSLSGVPRQEPTQGAPPAPRPAARPDAAPGIARERAGSGAVQTAFTSSSSPRVRLAWQRFVEIIEHPAGSKDFRLLTAEFNAIVEDSEDISEIEQAKEGLRLIKQWEDREERLRNIKEIVDKSRADDQEFERKLQEIGSSRSRLHEDNTGDSDPYLARGWVTGMGRFFGRQGTHQLLSGGQVLNYLVSEEGTGLNLDSFINRRVGVKGVVKELDPRYGADLIVVSEVVVLSDY